MVLKSIKYIKIIFLVILACSILTVYSDSNPSYWVRINSPTIRTLTRCIFTDTLNGWVVGDSGTIIHTSNGGLNWVSQNSKIDYPINNVFFLNPRLGWCIANNYYSQGTTILSTTNGGNFWNLSHYPDSTLLITDIHFVDSLTGFMCGYSGLVLKTTNAGINWLQCSVENNVYKEFPMQKITFYDSLHGAACGGIMDIAGLVWITTNGGTFWYTADTLPVPIVNVKYFGNQTIYATGGEFDFGVFICKSFNGGATWNNTNLGYIGIAQSIAFRTPNECWVPMGYSQYWIISIDSGHSWSTYPLPDSSGIFDVVFFNQNLGWAFGRYGSIYKYNPVIGITKNSTTVSQFRLYQNYPNPFNPTTEIRYEIPLAKEVRGMDYFVSLKIYDILGREVTTLVNEKQNEGSYRVQFNGSNLASGVYFYRLEITSNGSSVNYVESKKMLLIK